jgi:uncharacterized protein (DUF1810 family)
MVSYMIFWGVSGMLTVTVSIASGLKQGHEQDLSTSAMSLERFVQAQEKTYAGALAELKAGEKTGHWIWWIFPQLKGLGTSHNSTFYGIADEAEALAYLQHPVLGVRYRECVELVHEHFCRGATPPLVLMGDEIDVIKLRSSLELFLKIAPTIDETFRTQAEEVLAILK